MFLLHNGNISQKVSNDSKSVVSPRDVSETIGTVLVTGRAKKIAVIAKIVSSLRYRNGIEVYLVWSLP